jgi:hypothetical protein
VSIAEIFHGFQPASGSFIIAAIVSPPSAIFSAAFQSIIATLSRQTYIIIDFHSFPLHDAYGISRRPDFLRCFSRPLLFRFEFLFIFLRAAVSFSYF